MKLINIKHQYEDKLIADLKEQIIKEVKAELLHDPHELYLKMLKQVKRDVKRAIYHSIKKKLTRLGIF